MVAIPIIDIGPLVSNSPDAGAVAAAIGRACRETGFFYVVGHGIAPETVETVFAMSRAFFGQPLAAKAEGRVVRTVGQPRLDQARQRGPRSRQAP